MNPTSRSLSQAACRGIERAGNHWIPGGAGFPSFSASLTLTQIDRIADHLLPSDRKELDLLCTFLSFFPGFLLSWFLDLCERSALWPSDGPIGGLLRQVRIGLKGIVLTLYYSDACGDRQVHDLIHWDAKCGESAVPALTEVQRAFQRARAAQGWIQRVPVRERVGRIRRLKEVIVRRKEEIIDRLVQENLKSRTDALVSEIFPLLDHLDYLQSRAEKILNPRKVKTPVALLGKRSEVWLEGLGTVLVIAPWNYPFYQALTPITTALVCGNAVVFKPSEVTPLQGLVEECLKEAGIPETWVQIVYGDGKVGVELIAQKPDKIFFTGSAATGRKILAQAAPLLIPVELELGGKDAMIVFEDAEIKRAAHAAVWGAFTNTGQSCTSIERVWVRETKADEFLRRVVEEAKSLTQIKTQGVDPDGTFDLGWITRKEQVQVIADHLEDALAGGAILHTGQSWDRKSQAIPPLVLTGVTPQMKCLKEETFGPLLPLLSFRTEDEVIRAANQTEFGLAASVWSGDLTRARRVASRLRCGNVSINNVMITEGNHALPFGGVGESGMGRVKSEFGFYGFSNIKSIMLESSSKKIEGNWYPYTKEKYQLFSRLTESLFGKSGLRKWLGFAVNGLRLESLAKALRRES
jgi:acyl-CoA reductase-like NAD-dependent aldehyde dehydrogenase